MCAPLTNHKFYNFVLKFQNFRYFIRNMVSMEAHDRFKTGDVPTKLPISKLLLILDF